MFGLGKSAKDVITIFHKPSLRASTRVMNFLKQTHATAAETSTIDQASDHSKHSAVQRAEFDLEVVEQDPTPDQISTILSYVGHKRISEFVNGASSESDAIKKIKESADAFNRPVVVDWARGHALAGDVSDKEIVSLLNASLKD